MRISVYVCPPGSGPTFSFSISTPRCWITNKKLCHVLVVNRWRVQAFVPVGRHILFFELQCECIVFYRVRAATRTEKHLSICSSNKNTSPFLGMACITFPDMCHTNTETTLITIMLCRMCAQSDWYLCTAHGAHLQKGTRLLGGVYLAQFWPSVVCFIDQAMRMRRHSSQHVAA